jgi:acetate kinase
MTPQLILVLNAGSSSLKFAVYADEVRLDRGVIERLEPGDARRALDEVLRRIDGHGGLANVAAVGHRLVHGGGSFTAPTRLDDAALGALDALAPLDPDHLPAELAIVRAVRERAPTLLQVGCFDTAFHETLPRVARLLGIPRRFEAEGVRRYGFHGLSYQFLLDELRRVAGDDVAGGRLVLAHLGSGSSLAAVREGRCVDTSMSFTPNSGIVMGTRCGDLDAGLATYLLRRHGLAPDALDRLLSKESGLLGVSGVSADMRDLLAREATDPACADAVALYCHGVRKAVGALAATLGGVDTLVFTAGIGEGSAVVRARVCEGLAHLGVVLDEARNAAGLAVVSREGSACPVRVVRTDEELVVARETQRILRPAARTTDEGKGVSR